MNEAKTLLDQGGSLTEVALLLEAAIQKGELGKGGYEAWILLGEVRSMDEREEAGMRALAEGVKRAEAAGAAGEGMLVTLIHFVPIIISTHIIRPVFSNFLHERVLRKGCTYHTSSLACRTLPFL